MEQTKRKQARKGMDMLHGSICYARRAYGHV